MIWVAEIDENGVISCWMKLPEFVNAQEWKVSFLDYMGGEMRLTAGPEAGDGGMGFQWRPRNTGEWKRTFLVSRVGQPVSIPATMNPFGGQVTFIGT